MPRTSGRSCGWLPVVWSSAMRRGKTTQRERTKTTECKKPKEQLRAYSEQAACKGKGRGLRPPALAAFTGAAKGGQLEANVGRPGARVRSIWSRIASWPRFTTLLCAVSSSSSAWPGPSDGRLRGSEPGEASKGRGHITGGGHS